MCVIALIFKESGMIYLQTLSGSTKKSLCSNSIENDTYLQGAVSDLASDETALLA